MGCRTTAYAPRVVMPRTAGRTPRCRPSVAVGAARAAARQARARGKRPEHHTPGVEAERHEKRRSCNEAVAPSQRLGARRPPREQQPGDQQLLRREECRGQRAPGDRSPGHAANRERRVGRSQRHCRQPVSRHVTEPRHAAVSAALDSGRCDQPPALASAWGPGVYPGTACCSRRSAPAVSPRRRQSCNPPSHPGGRTCRGPCTTRRRSCTVVMTRSPSSTSSSSSFSPGRSPVNTIGDVFVRLESRQTDHLACQVDDADRAAHLEDVDVARLAGRCRLQDELAGLGDGHEVAW